VAMTIEERLRLMEFFDAARQDGTVERTKSLNQRIRDIFMIGTLVEDTEDQNGVGVNA